VWAGVGIRRSSGARYWIARARDAGRLTNRTGITLGLLLTAAGVAVPALLPHLAGLLVAAVLVGIGTGLITPPAFAALAAVRPPERIGQTMGSAEIGREFGDAGGCVPGRCSPTSTPARAHTTAWPPTHGPAGVDPL